jgi:hypothetical protein
MNGKSIDKVNYEIKLQHSRPVCQYTVKPACITVLALGSWNPDSIFD